MSASLLLRDFYRAGVRVSLGADGFLISPPDVAPVALEDALRMAWREVKAILEQLPASDRCEVCGDATRGPVGNAGHLRCTICALIVAERMRLRMTRTQPHDIPLKLIPEEVPDAA